MQNGVIFADFVNDLETPSFELVPRLKTIKEELYKAGFNVSVLLMLVVYAMRLGLSNFTAFEMVGCSDER